MIIVSAMATGKLLGYTSLNDWLTNLKISKPEYT